MKKFKVIKLTVNGSYELGTHEADDGNSAIKKAIKKLRPDENSKDVPFLIFVQCIEL